MNVSVLLLNVDYSPLEVISWRRAIVKVLDAKVEVVEESPSRLIRSPSLALPFPSVVRHIGRYIRRKPTFSRKNILARDGYTCQYCGARPRKQTGAPRLEYLTIDHVVPRAHARAGRVTLPWSGESVPVTSWQNVLTACRSCNGTKGGRTPAQAGLKMARLPARPTPTDLLWMDFRRVEIPAEWSFYLPDDHPWRGYWDDELDSG